MRARVVLVNPEARFRQGSAGRARGEKALPLLLGGEPVPLQDILGTGALIADIRWWLNKGHIVTEDGQPLPRARG